MVSIQDTTIPRSKPLKSFKDLLAWQPGQDEYNVAHTPLHPRPELLRRGVRYHRHGSDKPVPETSPETHDSGLEGCKVIVCHDMAGGYAEDVWPQGNDYNTIYSIQYWNYIDTFIYFSHYRITIPPPVWTNAAHKNGVRCLGTIITEWLEGVLETDEMVSGPGQEFVNEDGDDVVDRRWFSRTYADKLVDMAVYYKFDGWFINIESILRGGAKQANQTIAFLAYLRAQIHARIPGGELVWYDSVVSSTGEVNWQDRLTPENYQFFEQSDGIFTNYTWKEQFVGESVALAGPRNRDVYTGIDIWGRNTFGGGGFSTYRALEVIQREKTSCALFAPAWTYESLGKEKFMRNDRRFWIGSLGAGKHFEGRPPSSSPDQASRLLSGEQWANPAGGNKDGKDGEVDRKQQPEFLPVSAYIPARPSGTSSWFYSNFDRGFGTGFWVNGKKVSDKPWSHLSHQSLSPSLNKEVLILGPDSSNCVPVLERSFINWILLPEDAYNGGTSVVIYDIFWSLATSSFQPATPATDLSLPEKALHSGIRTILVPLFDTLISLPHAQSSSVELIYKPHQDQVQVGIHMGMLSAGLHKDQAQDQDQDQDQCRTGRKISKQEFSQLIRPEIKTPTIQSREQGSVSKIDISASSTSKKQGPVCLMTLDDPGASNALETGFVLNPSSSPQDDDRQVYRVETLAGGWQRLILNLSSLVNCQDMPGVAVSQLGVTVTYEQEERTGDQKMEWNPLVTLGSLAVVPTWSLYRKGSCVQGLRSEESRFVFLERLIPWNASIQGALQGQPEQGVIATLGKDHKHSWISVSSTLTWDIGFPIAHQSASSADPISTTEYSHYCVYVSLEKKKPELRSTETGKDGEPKEGAGHLMFVGTAFTTRYRVSDYEITLKHVHVPETMLSEDVSISDAEVALRQTDQEIWAWVQGIRRDGRADEKQDWGKTRLL